MANRLLILSLAHLVFLLARPSSGEGGFFSILNFFKKQCVSECPAKYFSSTYNEPCMDRCDKHGYSYYWCTTQKGWDYCSPAADVDYQGGPCLPGYYEYNECLLGGGTSWNMCARVEPKSLRYYTRYSKECIDDCQYYQRGDYFWCHTEDNWEYCSPLTDYTYRGQPCRLGDNCRFVGKSYSWCYTSFNNDWDYCGQVSSGECSYASESRRRKRQSDKTMLICTRKDNVNGKTKLTRFLDKGGQNFIAPVNNRLENEVLDLINQWNNRCSVQSRSNLIRSQNYRIDLQGTFRYNGRTYYNLQIQRNEQRQARKSTTVAQILVPDDTSAEYMRLAFKYSLQMRTRVQIEVEEVDSSDNNKCCTRRKQ